jgi:hypothetical protein
MLPSDRARSATSWRAQPSIACGPLWLAIERFACTLEARHGEGRHRSSVRRHVVARIEQHLTGVGTIGAMVCFGAMAATREGSAAENRMASRITAAPLAEQAQGPNELPFRVEDRIVLPRLVR